MPYLPRDEWAESKATDLYERSILVGILEEDALIYTLRIADGFRGWSLAWDGWGCATALDHVELGHRVCDYLYWENDNREFDPQNYWPRKTVRW